MRQRSKRRKRRNKRRQSRRTMTRRLMRRRQQCISIRAPLSRGGRGAEIDKEEQEMVMWHGGRSSD